MRPAHKFLFIGYTCSNDKQKKVLCSIELKYDIFKDDYFKLYIIAENDRYGKEEFYLSDLIGL